MLAVGRWEVEDMAMWQWGLLALGFLWALQSLGVWYQMRHYSDVMKGITSKYNDGFVGAGNVRGRLGKGVIVLILVTPDLVVQRFLVMSGRSVFAKVQAARGVRGHLAQCIAYRSGHGRCGGASYGQGGGAGDRTNRQGEGRTETARSNRELSQSTHRDDRFGRRSIRRREHVNSNNVGATC